MKQSELHLQAARVATSIEFINVMIGTAPEEQREYLREMKLLEIKKYSDILCDILKFAL